MSAEKTGVFQYARRPRPKLVGAGCGLGQRPHAGTSDSSAAFAFVIGPRTKAVLAKARVALPWGYDVKPLQGKGLRAKLIAKWRCPFKAHTLIPRRDKALGLQARDDRI